jgi:hypothetical protein
LRFVSFLQSFFFFPPLSFLSTDTSLLYSCFVNS